MAEHPGSKPGDGVAGSLPEVYTYKVKRYSVHPVADLFPLLEGPTREELVESLRVNGLARPIVVTGPEASVIIDGRNRFLAGLEAGVELRFEELPPGVDPISYIAIANLDRRDLTASQRAAIGVSIRKYRQDRTRDGDVEETDFPGAPSEPNPGPAAEDRSGTGQPSLPLHGQDSAVGAESVQSSSHTPSDPGGSLADRARDAQGSTKRTPTQKSTSDRMRVSVAQMRKTERVVEDAPELHQPMRDGVITANDAHAIRKEPRALRARALEDVKAGRAKTLKAAVENLHAADAAGKETAGNPTPPADPAAVDKRMTERVRSEAGSRGQDVADVPTDPSTRPEATDGGGKHVGPAANRSVSPSEAPAAPAAGEHRENPPVESASSLIVAPEIVRALDLAFGRIDAAFCSAAAAKHDLRTRHRHDPAHSDLSKPWRGCVLLVPPASRLAAFAEKLLSALNTGDVQRAAVLTPLDPTVDLFLDAEYLDLFVLERCGPNVRRSGTRAAGMPRTALFLFGLSGLTSDLVATLAPWGHALRPGSGSQVETLVNDAAASARGLWNRVTGSGGASRG